MINQKEIFLDEFKKGNVIIRLSTEEQYNKLIEFLRLNNIYWLSEKYANLISNNTITEGKMRQNIKQTKSNVKPIIEPPAPQPKNLKWENIIDKNGIIGISYDQFNGILVPWDAINFVEFIISDKDNKQSIISFEHIKNIINKELKEV